MCMKVPTAALVMASSRIIRAAAATAGGSIGQALVSHCLLACPAAFIIHTVVIKKHIYNTVQVIYTSMSDRNDYY